MDIKNETENQRSSFAAEAELLKTLGHPVRLRIIEVLINNKSCVKNIWETLGLPQATVSQHLVSLKNKGIVSCKRDGVRMCYQLSDKRIEKIFNELKYYGNSFNNEHGAKAGNSVLSNLPK
ncbi:MAG: metalloregulator ArsR/SmtB family transcription factor [Deltaproteobacteria bacterium]|nr:metalloregulator ArsR/SmtB family transcription factor [Deltaproteobacteria bacterium]